MGLWSCTPSTTNGNSWYKFQKSKPFAKHIELRRKREHLQNDLHGLFDYARLELIYLRGGPSVRGRYAPREVQTLHAAQSYALLIILSRVDIKGLRWGHAYARTNSGEDHSRKHIGVLSSNILRVLSLLPILQLKPQRYQNQ
jgi:hypothetical protein